MLKVMQLSYEDLNIKITYKKIKNIILKIKKNKAIELSVPTRIKEEEIISFLKHKKDWIIKTLDKYKEINTNDFYYLGQKLEIKQQHSPSRLLKVDVADKFFLIHLHDGVPLSTRNRLLEKHYKEKLLDIVQEFFEKWEKSLGVSKNSLTIKKLKGKWGYCNTKNNDICLNLELIKKDLQFIEYVVLHELCHILVPNHGPKFKELLNIHMPNWRKIDKEFSI